MKWVDSRNGNGAEARWADSLPMNFQQYGAGEFVGPARSPILDEYILRPGDEIQILYYVNDRADTPYRLAVGDEVMITSLIAEDINIGTLTKGVSVQSSGSIVIPIIGTVPAKGLTIPELKKQIEKQLKDYNNEPEVDVLPVKTYVAAKQLRETIAGQSGLSLSSINATVRSDGAISLTGAGRIYAQGNSLSDLQTEINLRYAENGYTGLSVGLNLLKEAPRSISVVGQVGEAGRFDMTRPLSVMDAVSLAKGPLAGANLRQVVLFRRAADWRLVSTMLDLRGAFYGKRPVPSDNIFLRDGDIVVIPKSKIKQFNDFVQQVFTDGFYGVVPINATVDVAGGQL